MTKTHSFMFRVHYSHHRRFNFVHSFPLFCSRYLIPGMFQNVLSWTPTSWYFDYGNPLRFLLLGAWKPRQLETTLNKIPCLSFHRPCWRWDPVTALQPCALRSDGGQAGSLWLPDYSELVLPECGIIHLV